MRIYIFDIDRIISFDLPNKIIGNFWIQNSEGNNLINVYAKNNAWNISSNNDYKINYNNNIVNDVPFEKKKYYFLTKEEKKILFYADDIVDYTFKNYKINSSTNIIISSKEDSDIIISGFNSEISIKYDGYWSLTNNSNILYINGIKTELKETMLNNGDIININGIKIALASGILLVNNPFNNVKVNSTKLSLINIEINNNILHEEIDIKPLYTDDDYFFKSPRLERKITETNINIDSPPGKNENEEMPLIYTIVPMLSMGASSIITLLNTIESINSGEKQVKEVWPNLLITSLLIVSMLVWPFITKLYQKRQKKKKEKERQQKYSAYLDEKKKLIASEYNLQKDIYEENLLNTNICYNNIINRNRILWERKLGEEDFLTVRVGLGNTKFKANIAYHTEDFSMSNDNLKKELEDLINNYKELINVPVGYSFYENNITAINGMYPKYLDFTNNMILQMMAYHSYDSLKIVVLTNEKKETRWTYIKNSPYCFSNDKDIRFFSTNNDEAIDLSNYLCQVFSNRELLTNGGKDKPQYNTYYLIITDNIDETRQLDILDKVFKSKINMGFSIIILEDKLSKIPSQCSNFIVIGSKNSGILKNTDDGNIQMNFKDEILKYDMDKVSYTLFNTPVFIESKSGSIPNSITFLEMFGVGRVEQLNAINRWKNNDPTKSLKAEIGADKSGENFYLDIHEKAHGPHGLVAGMTGSGKSELLIAIILSLAVNYSPEEVAFVLIDYKGGGLAGAFENKETGIRLPHIVGTVTNLDKAEINRSLASINSELIRRQQIFNEARDAYGESSVDIYKYQKMYREHKVSEPMPHLVIISDEFAELKSQQPDFMNDLVSTARIGRSLGVHLILATQKPSGVVDAQIWSNSKFKLCLKVQDKSDSNEMLKKPDAAELKQVGRFYLQVGYDEYYALGQSAYAGAKYYPSDTFKGNIDSNIYLINNIGIPYKSLDNSVKKSTASQGEEVTNIVKYLIDVAEAMNFNLKKLWLDKIPEIILINDLWKKYNYKKQKYIINPVIGEYDDPTVQSQNILTLPITKEGNTIIYGGADSGRDDFVQSLAYSLIETYDSEELNLYLLDFGAETLNNFLDAPQVGGVIINGEEEELTSFIKLINNEIVKRKKLFTAYNGSYLEFIKRSENKLPNIVVIVNVIDALAENYGDLVEGLYIALREGSKYGVNFVITATSLTSARLKVTQNCKQVFCLQLNDEGDYRDALGKTNGLIPSKIPGRGLAKLERICEFQTASITKEDKFDAIKNLINVLNSKLAKKAKKVPMMPEIIELNDMTPLFNNIDYIPIGIYKDSLDTCLYPYTKEVINLISSQEMENMSGFLTNFIKLINSKDTFNKVVIDAGHFFDEMNENINYVTNNFNELIDSLKNIDNTLQTELEKVGNNIKKLKDTKNTLCLVIGFDKFFEKLDDDHKKIFKEIIHNNKELLKINFIICDVPSNIKKYEYEDWYKECTDPNNGLWIGPGVNQQFAIKLSINPSSLSNITKTFAVVVRSGKPTIIKLINEYKKM